MSAGFFTVNKVADLIFLCYNVFVNDDEVRSEKRRRVYFEDIYTRHQPRRNREGASLLGDVALRWWCELFVGLRWKYGREDDGYGFIH